MSQLPDHVNEIIVGHLDILSRLMVRKTSAPFRDLVDRDRLYIKKLYINYTFNSIVLTDHEGFQATYLDIGGIGTLVQCDRENQLLKGKNFVDLFKVDLMTILLNRNLTIHTLLFEHNHHPVTSLSLRDDSESIAADMRIDGRLMSIFRDLNHQLTVDNLIAKMQTPRDIKELFLRLDPNTIRHLEFPHYGGMNMRHLLRDEDVLNSEQFRNLKTFHSDEPVDVRDFHKLVHCSIIKVKIMRKMTQEQIESVKEILFRNPNLNVMKIAEWLPHRSPRDGANQEEEIWRSAAYPGNFRKRISWLVTQDGVEFRGPCYVEERPQQVEAVPVQREAPREMFFDADFD